MNRWNQLHQEVLTFAQRRSQEEHSLGRLLLRVKKARVWQHLRIQSIYAYARSFMGLTTRQTKERLRVAKALKKLPKLDTTLAAGTIQWSAVRELLRVVTSANEGQWVEQVRDKSVDEIATMIDGTERGGDPPDPKVPRRRRVILRMMPSILALYREAQAKLREDSGGELSEEDGLMLMSRMVLGNTNSGTSAYQIQMTVCETCDSAVQKSCEQTVAVEPRDVEQARCDAEIIGVDLPVVHPSLSDVRELVVGRQDAQCGFPACQNEIGPEVHVLPGEAEGTPDPDRRVALCPAHHAAAHRGDVRVEGRWSTDVRYLDGDGSPLGNVRDEGVSALMADLSDGLRHLGIKKRERRAIVDRVRCHVGEAATLPEVVDGQGSPSKNDSRPRARCRT